MSRDDIEVMINSWERLLDRLESRDRSHWPADIRASVDRSIDELQRLIAEAKATIAARDRPQ